MNVSRSSKAQRLHVVLASLGLGSRRACEKAIEEGRVSVDGYMAVRGQKILGNPSIIFDRKQVSFQTKKQQYFVINKPKGFLCSQNDEKKRPLLVSLFPKAYQKHLFHVGRLDFNTQGLMLYTNDGEWAHRVMHPHFGIEKEYRAILSSKVDKTSLEQFRKGIRIEGILYRLRNYRLIDPYIVHLTLNEGKNREIRRFFSFTGQYLNELSRIRVGLLNLKNLPLGHFRSLTKQEVQSFMVK